MRQLQGRPMLGHIIDRVATAGIIDQVVVATSTTSADEPVVAYCDSVGVASFRGSEEDVLDRFYQCAMFHHAGTIVRITADDPLKDPVVISRIVEVFHANESLEYASNTIIPTFPEGLDVEVFSKALLEMAWTNATSNFEREHVTPYMIKRGRGTLNVANPKDLSQMRWTVDTPEDFQFVERVYAELYEPGKIFLMEDVLSLLERNPSIATVNSDVQRSHRYRSN